MSERLEESVARIGFFATGGYLLWAAHSAWSAQGEVMWRPLSLVGAFVCYGSAFALLGLGAAHRRPQRFSLWLLPAFLLALAGAWRGKDLQSLPWTDSALFSSYSAHLLLLGENPYEWDLSDAYGAYRTPQIYSTPRLDGASVSRLSYPALHFLALVPLAALGVEESRVLYGLAIAGIAVLLFRRAPPALRPLVLVPLFANPELLDFALNRITDPVWALLLVLTVQSWRRPSRRGLWYGLACAYKQTPWLLAPFLAIRLWQDRDDADTAPPRQRLVRFFGTAGAVFLLLNGPFLALAPRAWLSAVADPLAAPLVYLGTGLSSLTLTGALELPKHFYTLASGAVMAALVVLYALRFRRLREAMWLFPGIALWFSYRSLHSYFVFWVPVLIAVAVEAAREHQPEPDPQPEPEPPLGLSDRGLALGGGAAAVALVAAAVSSGAGGPAVSVELLDAKLAAASAEAVQVDVAVTNRSDRVLTPRLAAQKASWQPYPWRILSGPESLAPGQMGVYRAGTDVPHRSLGLREGGQIVVTDSSGRPEQRGTARVEPDHSFGVPDGVYNSGYREAAGSRGVPSGWVLRHDGESAPTLSPARTQGGLVAVSIGFAATPERGQWETATLSQPVLFSNARVSAWVFGAEPELGERGLTRVQGLQFADEARTLWVLFGPDAGVAGYLAPDHAYVTVPTPVGTWSRAEFRLDRFYERLGWPRPPLQRLARGNLDMLGRLVTMSLLVAARDQPEMRRIEARFGPIELESGDALVPGRIRERAANPREYYLALAERERAQGHPELAEQHARRASEYRP